MSSSAKVSEKRLSELFAAAGFQIASRWYGDAAWNRWNPVLGISEWILVGFSGKRNEAVSTDVGVGITRNLAFGISHELLVEAADSHEMVDQHGFWSPGRGKAILETVELSRAWERRVAEIAPTAAECYARKHRNELLERTIYARQRASELLRQFDANKPRFEQIQELKVRYGNAYAVEAQRLAEWPGVMQVFDADELYVLACFFVLTGDEGPAFIGQDPLKNDELMWQIQLVVDGILFAVKGSR